MTAQELVAAVRAAGLRLEARPGDVLHVAPRDRLTPPLREALRAHKTAVLAVLRGRVNGGARGADWTRVPLHALDRVLEVAVPWSDVRLVIAPGCRVARELRSQEPRPGRVWCACELADLLLSGVSPEDARKVAGARLAFDGTAVRAGRDPHGHGRTPAAAARLRQ